MAISSFKKRNTNKRGKRKDSKQFSNRGVKYNEDEKKKVTINREDIKAEILKEKVIRGGTLVGRK